MAAILPKRPLDTFQVAFRRHTKQRLPENPTLLFQVASPAAGYLKKQGCRILARNWHCRYGEIDIIAEQGGTYQRNPALQKFPEVLSVTKRTDGKYTYKVKDWFKKYPTPEACFTDHALLFLNNKRYAEALKVKTDPYLFAEAIARAGYATAPDYATQLKKIIKQLSK